MYYNRKGRDRLWYKKTETTEILQPVGMVMVTEFPPNFLHLLSNILNLDLLLFVVLLH